jgi:pimeloyl-ACP methyl ester carboxylesterase
MSFPAQPPPLPGVVHTDVRVDRVRWHVATAGEKDAPPIVLLHGWPQHWWIWRRVIGDLAKTHRVYAPDMRGFGWSEAPEGRYSKMGLACDIERLMDVLEIDRATLAGHDWGGFVALLAAIRMPDRVDRVAAFSIIHPWLRVGAERPSPLALLRTAGYQLPLSTPLLGPLVAGSGLFMREALRRGAGPGFHWDPQDLRLYADSWARRDHGRATSALYRTFLTRELPALAGGRYGNRRLAMPVLLATGEHDPIVTPSRIAGAEGHVTDLTTAVIEGAGHFVADEKPAEVARLIRVLVDS